ncbi:helix-turn-helix transcriptional regulator [Luteimonas sp. MJ246]|uniref:helix-turn-helix domain-containing protein n=1 Tax=Luteimonas sp. MJ174 TaxID=3129237 RepID=UPI0031BA9E4A
MELADALHSIGRALQRRRLLTGLSQDKFADQIGMHRAYYGALERGQQNLTLATLLKVCGGLGVDASTILREASL